MNMFFLSLLSVILFVTFVVNESNGESNYYRAAVFEHAMARDFALPKKEIIDRNLMTYETATNTASVNGADIIVFPEYGVFPHNTSNRAWLFGLSEDIPNPTHLPSNPCNEATSFNNRPILRRLSCMAKENSIFVVANIVDAKKCQISDTCDTDNIDSCRSNDHCPEDEILFHNTNVVFNREGFLIARYYKRHLYFEHDLNPIRNPEDTYFETDFGNFTTFVCFDLTFQDSVGAIEKRKIHNVAYPTYWFDHTPPTYFATPFQQSWAITNEVNLLAASTHYPGTGSLGSGIYSANKGALIYTQNPDGKSKLLISNVPKYINEDIPLNTRSFVIDNNEVTDTTKEKKKSDFENFCQFNVLGLGKDFKKDYRCHPSDFTNYTFAKLSKSRDTLNLCSNHLCCSLSYESNGVEEDYYFAVGAENMDFRGYIFGIEKCFVARCEEYDGKICSNFILNSNTIFKKAEIKGNFTSKYIYPFVVNSGMQLTSRNDWAFDKKSFIKYYNTDGSSLLYLALYGRNYDQDILLSE